MFKLLLDKELKEIVGTTKFAVTFGVCAVLILLAFYVGARNYDVSRQEYEGAVVENMRQMEGLTDWGEIDHRIFLPPQPLAALVSGISNDIGRTIDIESRGELRAEDSRFNEDPIFAVFRFLDLEFIFTIVLSLFAILFGYDAINGEKERGTLALSFANPVPRDQYVLAKLVGSFLALVVPLMIPILIGCVMLPLLGVPMDGDSWIRLAMVIFAGVLYFGVFLTLSVFISAMTQHSSSSFLMLLVVWIFMVLIIPRASVLISGQAVDVPSVDQIDYEKSKYSRQLFSERMNGMQEFIQENRNNDDHAQFMADMQEFMGQQQDDFDAKMLVLTEQLNEQRNNKAARRQKFALALARISPTASFSLAAADLASTSLALRSSYMDAANSYQAAFAQFMQSKNADTQGFRFMRHGDDEVEEPEEIDLRELPAFTYEPPDVSDAIGASLPDLGLLLLFNIVFFAGAFVAFLKYDVR
ncbi:MAG: ABC transporter permease [Bacteroidetes bacterium]|nr:ABC transporter permease [Bacteroidota bacterium]